jgi:hypothetical protein
LVAQATKRGTERNQLLGPNPAVAAERIHAAFPARHDRFDRFAGHEPPAAL